MFRWIAGELGLGVGSGSFCRPDVTPRYSLAIIGAQALPA